MMLPWKAPLSEECGWPVWGSCKTPSSWVEMLLPTTWPERYLLVKKRSRDRFRGRHCQWDNHVFLVAPMWRSALGYQELSESPHEDKTGNIIVRLELCMIWREEGIVVKFPLLAFSIKMLWGPLAFLIPFWATPLSSTGMLSFESFDIFLFISNTLILNFININLQIR